MHRSRPFPPIPLAAALLLGLVAAPAAPADGSDLADRLEAQLRPLADGGFLSGCILVAEGDAIIYEECFGKADAEHGVDNDTTTRFAIASITKSLHLILLARLLDEGKLRLEDHLERWIPGFPLADTLTVEDLVNNTAGIPHRVTENDAETLPRTAAEMVKLVEKRGLVKEMVGTRSYSSAGYSVLAYVLEKAGGASWEALMQRYVFAPAGMDATLHPSGGGLVPHRARSYYWTLEGLRNEQPKDLSFLVGAGSLYSTPRDLRSCVRALVHGTYGETAKSYLIEEGELLSAGNTNGYRAFVQYDVASDRTVAVCANVFTGAFDHLRETLPSLVAGEEVEPPTVPDDSDAIGVDAETLRELSGRYELRPGTILDVHPRGSVLYADQWLLIPQGGDTFFCLTNDSRVVFARDESGAVLRMDWGEKPYPMPRVGDRDVHDE